jgi:hypothetical protein
MIVPSLLRTQIESYPKNRQSNRQKPEITSERNQSTVLRSLNLNEKRPEHYLRLGATDEIAASLQLLKRTHAGDGCVGNQGPTVIKK